MNVYKMTNTFMAFARSWTLKSERTNYPHSHYYYDCIFCGRLIRVVVVVVWRYIFHFSHRIRIHIMMLWHSAHSKVCELSPRVQAPCAACLSALIKLWLVILSLLRSRRDESAVSRSTAYGIPFMCIVLYLLNYSPTCSTADQQY